jgi:hypothetical protein
MGKRDLSPEALALIDSVLEAKDWTNPKVQEDFDAKEVRKQARLARNRIKDRARWPGNRTPRKRINGVMVRQESVQKMDTPRGHIS